MKRYVAAGDPEAQRERIEERYYPVGKVAVDALLATDPKERVREALGAARRSPGRPFERFWLAHDLLHAEPTS